MFTLTVTAQDWTEAGATPGSGYLEVEFLHPILGDPVTTTARWTARLGGDGTGSWTVPTIPVDNALKVRSRVNGLYQGKTFYFADPGTGPQTLTELLETRQVDPATLEPALTIGRAATSAAHGEATSSLTAALPDLLKAIRTYDDSNPRTLRQIDLGSSVGLGPGGILDPVNSVGSHLFAKLGPILNRTGALVLEHTNAAVGGSTITAGQQTDYDTAKTAAGGAPTLVPLIYGMNDGRASQYHQGQTLPGVYNNGKVLIQAIQGDGADAIIFTTPHPHTGRTPWDDATGSIYPPGGMVPDATADGSVVTVTSRSGVTVPASYRHLRVNESLRQLGADLGVPVVDVEAYWFDAVAELGEDALFEGGEYVHPNLLGFRRSYHPAIDDFVKGLTRPTTYAAAAPAPRELFVRKPQHTVRTSADTITYDPDLGIPVAAGETWIVAWEVHYTTPLAADLRLTALIPDGATGRFAVTGPEARATGPASNLVARSGAIFSGNYIPVGGNDTDAVATVTATVEVGNQGGGISLGWCQDSSNPGNTIVYANSSLRATRIG